MCSSRAPRCGHRTVRLSTTRSVFECAVDPSTARAQAYDSSVDMWAIGVCAFMLLSGKRPFHHQDRKEKKRMIQQDPVRAR